MTLRGRREHAEDDGPTYDDTVAEEEAIARFKNAVESEHIRHIGDEEEAMRAKTPPTINEEPKPLPHNEPRVRSQRTISARGKTEEIVIQIDNPPSDQAAVILFRLMTNWVQEFMSKNADYGDTSAQLGAAGQYAELWRKVGKLKGPLWDGKELNHEQADEIVRDLIGHCFLTLLFLEEDNIR